MNSDLIEQIKQKLRNPGIYQRKLALDELATIQSDVAVPILRELAQANDFALRKIAVMGLGNHHTPESFELLKQILIIEQDPNVLAEAANSLVNFGDQSIELLRQLFIDSNNWLVHQTVIAILADSNCPKVLLEVVNLAIEDEVQTTKETAILALSRLLDTPLQSQVLGILATLSQADDWRTRWRTAIALTASQAHQGRELLVKLQQDSHYRVVAAAMEQPTSPAQ